MTKTQNSSFAATVLNALNTAGLYQTAALKATVTETGTPAGYTDTVRPLFDVILHFSPYTVSGITLAAQLDKALEANNIGHTVHIDWDMDVVVYTHGWENYSVSNWTDDPSMAVQPSRVKLGAVTRRNYTTVLTTFLDAVGVIVTDPSTALRGKLPPVTRAEIADPAYDRPKS